MLGAIVGGIFGSPIGGAIRPGEPGGQPIAGGTAQTGSPIVRAVVPGGGVIGGILGSPMLGAIGGGIFGSPIGGAIVGGGIVPGPHRGFTLPGGQSNGGAIPGGGVIGGITGVGAELA